MASFLWRALAPLQHPRARPVAVPLDDGRVLVAGGHVSIYAPHYEVQAVSTIEVYDPRHDLWSSGDKLVGRDGKFTGVTGLHWDGATRQWKRMTHLPAPDKPGSVVLHDGSRLFAGGTKWKGGRPFGKRETAHRDTRLRPRHGRPQPSPLHEARIDAMLTLLSDGRVLVTGGYQTSLDYSWETTCRSVGRVEVLDLDEGTIDDGGMLICARHDHTAVLLPDGAVLLVGGRRDEGRDLVHVELGSPRGA